LQQDGMSSAGDMFSATFQKLDYMINRTGTNKQLCYIILAFFVFFFLVYVLVFRRSAPESTP
jgi:hypothetical protein